MIKDEDFTLPTLLGSTTLAAAFDGGTMYTVRLVRRASDLAVGTWGERCWTDADAPSRTAGLGFFQARCRQAPQDYHRFHSPVTGNITSITDISGTIYAVNGASSSWAREDSACVQ